MRAPAFPHTALTLRDTAHSYWLTLPLRVDAACAAHADCQVYPLALQFVHPPYPPLCPCVPVTHTLVSSVSYGSVCGGLSEPTFFGSI